MKGTFAYSILQYKYSVALGEAINVGVLFAFPEEKVVRFFYSSGKRVQGVYPKFDSEVFKYKIQAIKEAVDKSIDLWKEIDLLNDFSLFVKRHILLEDATALQFTKPFYAEKVLDNVDDVVKVYASRLLLDIETPKKKPLKRDESFLLREYTNLISLRYNGLEHKLKSPRIIESNHIKVKYDLSWQNGKLNLVEPISFDLLEGREIQKKALHVFGEITALNEYALEKNIAFHILVSRPQEQKLQTAYADAISLIGSAKSPHRIVTERQLDEYADETVSALLSH